MALNLRGQSAPGHAAAAATASSARLGSVSAPSRLRPGAAPWRADQRRALCRGRCLALAGGPRSREQHRERTSERAGKRAGETRRPRRADGGWRAAAPADDGRHEQDAGRDRAGTARLAAVVAVPPGPRGDGGPLSAPIAHLPGTHRAGRSVEPAGVAAWLGQRLVWACGDW